MITSLKELTTTTGSPTTEPSPTIEPTLNPTLDPTPSPTPHPTIAPTLEPTMETTVLVTEVPSRDKSYIATFYVVVISILVLFVCVFGFIYWYKTRRDASMSRHRRLEDALRGIEFRKVFKKPSGGEYSGLL